MKRYNPKDIEPKWQQRWEKDGTYLANLHSKKPKYYGFAMFNYPSGAGIHVGHVRNYTIPDVVTRAKRQQGYEVYQPVGWDSFGLPAENFAIKTGVSPQESTKKAIEKYRQQYTAMGWGVDWSKEINTTDPEYYRWTQWIFLKLLENKLAYQKDSAQWWCNSCKTVLADEQVVAGKCWRHDNPDDPLISKKSLKQWFFKITDYADEILEATDDLDWTPSVRASQKSWIGKSVGAEIIFELDSDNSITVFTTRADTVFSAAFLVLAPEHPMVKNITTDQQKTQVDSYIEKSLRKSELERQVDGDKEKTGVFTGAYATNPANEEKIPIWIADFVLFGYGTGAVFGNIHDERDFQFIKKFDIPARVSVVPESESEAKKVLAKEFSYTTEGILVDSGKFDGLQSAVAREEITKWLADKGSANEKVNYKMRDWLISRQRYWGAPIPVIHCHKCGALPVPEEDLPVELPAIKDYQPTGENVSVLAGATDWVNVPCPKCHGPAARETDTMDGYVCSSWYFFRYLDPANNQQAWSSDLADKWMPVNFYNGGDHATAHLLYARFFARFFNKLGMVNTPEPFTKMVYNGKVRAADGTAFSKSKGNGVDPLEIIGQGYGADALRVYEMFAAPVEQNVLWDPQGVPGCFRFLTRAWNIVTEFVEAKAVQSDPKADDEVLRVAHRTIKKVSHDIVAGKFNTAISAMMEAVNDYHKLKDSYGISNSPAWRTATESLIQLLAPFAPHITEELWSNLGHDDTVHIDHWPIHDPKYLVTDMINIAVQVNGKLRANIMVKTSADEIEVCMAARADENVAKYLVGEPKKTVYIPSRIVNFVV